MLCRIGWLEMPHGRVLSGHKGLFEIRYRGHRILYTVRNNHVMLLHAFAKKSRKTPRKEINVAMKRLKSLA